MVKGKGKKKKRRTASETAKLVPSRLLGNLAKDTAEEQKEEPVEQDDDKKGHYIQLKQEVDDLSGLIAEMKRLRNKLRNKNK